MLKLDGKIALITGGARGIGREIARRFAEEGATVIITDVDDEAGTRACADLDVAAFRHLDVTSEDEWVAVMGAVQAAHGGLDVLVNNAGVMSAGRGFQDPERFDLASWRRVHAVNLDGVALGCKYAIRLMKRRGGAIVNVSSRAASVGVAKLAAYASSKAAVRNHTRTVALHCAASGYAIRCNAVAPGIIHTDMLEQTLGAARDERLRDLAREVPLGRLGTALDVANAVLFLACDDSAYITGAEIEVSGGATSPAS